MRRITRYALPLLVGTAAALGVVTAAPGMAHAAPPEEPLPSTGGCLTGIRVYNPTKLVVTVDEHGHKKLEQGGNECYIVG